MAACRQAAVDLDRSDLLGQACDERGLITRARADLQYFIQRACSQQQLAHARDHIGLRDGLVTAYRQGSVFVSPARQCLVYETVPGHTVHRIEYPLITNPLTRKTLHHSRTRSFTR